jgi:hypothetical protein
VSGTFNGLPNNAVFPVDSQQFRINYFSNTSPPGNDVVLVVNSPAMIRDVVLPTPVIEGDIATLSGRLVDPDAGDVLRLFVNWGDGSPTVTIVPNRQPFTLVHRYPDNPPGVASNSYVVRFAWTDPHGGSNSRSQVVTVLTADANQRFVAQVYRTVLGRAVDLPSLAFWSSLLDRGFSRIHFVRIVRNSLEARTVALRRLFAASQNQQ